MRAAYIAMETQRFKLLDIAEYKAKPVCGKFQWAAQQLQADANRPVS